MKTQEQNALILDKEIVGWEDFSLTNTLKAVVTRFAKAFS